MDAQSKRSLGVCNSRIEADRFHGGFSVCELSIWGAGN